MGDSGYIDWHSLAKHPDWYPTREGQHAVYCFWLVDYGRAERDSGVSLFKPEGGHPDWFLHHERADHSLAAYCSPDMIVSGNFDEVFDDTLAARPLLGSLLLGTRGTTYRSMIDRRLWTCELHNLDRRGKKIIEDLSSMYLRPPHIITFTDLQPMEERVPEAGDGTATANPASGHGR